MDFAPSVSVVIPTFNRRHIIARAIKSALQQTYGPHEIIVVDDGSTPKLQAADLGCEDARVRIICRAQNGGAAAARQTGIEAATGDLVAFLDSDDIWYPNKLGAQVPLLATALTCGDLLAVSCGWQSVRDDGRTVGVRFPMPTSDPADFAGGCWFSPGTTVILPRGAFARVGPLDTRLRRLEDLEWFLRFALAGGRLAVAPEIGARIALGRRAGRLHVEDAALKISTRFGDWSTPRGGTTISRNLNAYLNLERAVAARNDGKFVLTALFLLRSLMCRPRTTLSVKPWWQQTPWPAAQCIAPNCTAEG